MSNDQNPYFQMADMWMKGTTPPKRVYLTPAEQHRLLNESLSSDYDIYPQWVNAVVWIPIFFGFVMGIGAIGYGLYCWLF